MPNIAFWLIFGSLIGWIALLINQGATKKGHPFILSGLVGACAGGILAQLISVGRLMSGYNDISVVSAVISAGILVGIVYKFAANRTPS